MVVVRLNLSLFVKIIIGGSTSVGLLCITDVLKLSVADKAFSILSDRIL